MRVSNNTEWLFFHLWKKNPDTMLPCQNLYVAETIIFRWAQPYFWYSTAKDGMIIRRTKEKILLQNIEESFLNNIPKCEVISNTLTSFEDPALKLQEKIEFDYVQKADFHDFLFQREKSHNIIIQKFIEPKNSQNALIKVSWTPQFCLFFRKTNVNDITNTKIPLANRLVTFEGLEHLSNSDSISSPILASELEQTCLNIVKHVHSVTSGNVQISKMVLYFKLDDRNRLWLLFCTGLKLREKNNNSNNAAAFKKKADRPLSPVMMIASKKDKDPHKSRIPLQYLLEDQINQIDANSCIRCNKEDLLYDLKLKHVLDHEEKIIKGQRMNDVDVVDEIENESPAPFFGAIPGSEKSKANIPRVMRKLYPNVTEERYQKLKKNVSLVNMTVKLCESCYLNITENLLENPEEKNAKKLQTHMREIAKKDPENYGFGSLSSMKKRDSNQLANDRSMKVINQPLKSGHDHENSRIGINDYDLISSKKMSQDLFQPVESSAFKTSGKISLFSKTAQNFNVKPVLDEQNDYLPPIGTTEPLDLKAYETDFTKQYYTRNHREIGARPSKDDITDMRQVRSPYASEMTVKIWQRDDFDMRSLESKKNPPFPSPPQQPRSMASTMTRIKSPVASSWRNGRADNFRRTTYSSMLDTIKDLKSFLGQSLNE